MSNSRREIQRRNREILKERQKNGVYRAYYPNGQLKIEGNYKDGKEDGFWTVWYENGKKKAEGNYKNGDQVGKWTIYNEDGSVKLVYEN